MIPTLKLLNTKIYNPGSFTITNYVTEKEGVVYEACEFILNENQIICRTAKITPKKAGQFVTFWNRNSEGITQPFSENDAFDFYVINVFKGGLVGQFVIPKAVGIAKGLVSTEAKQGKRGFRVYPPWDIATNAQAKRTQLWQLDYFISLVDPIDIELVKKRYTSD